MLTKGKGVASPPLLQSPLHPSAPKREMEIHVNLGEWGFGENNTCKWPTSKEKGLDVLREASMEPIRWRRLTSAVARVVLGRLPDARWATLIMVNPLMVDWCRLILLIDVSVRTFQKENFTIWPIVLWVDLQNTSEVSTDQRYFLRFFECRPSGIIHRNLEDVEIMAIILRKIESNLAINQIRNTKRFIHLLYLLLDTHNNYRNLEIF
jgi:hypothetical protein